MRLFKSSVAERQDATHSLNDDFDSRLLTSSEIEGPWERALSVLLEEMGWTGRPRQIVEARPHLLYIEDLDEIRATLIRLGFETATHRLAPAELNADALPSLSIVDGNAAVLIGFEENGDLAYFDAVREEFLHVNRNKKLLVCFVRPDTQREGEDGQTKRAWFWESLSHFRKPITGIFFITFLANLLSMATPLYVMTVYDKVVAGRAIETLFSLIAIIVATFLFETWLRFNRSRMIAYVGARFHNALANRALQKILNLPIHMIEGASTSAQIMRFRQFEGVRAFFTGHIISAVLDLPFILLFLALIVWLAGSIALIPLSLVIAFAVMAVVTVPGTRRNTQASGQARNKAGRFVSETLDNVFAIRQLHIGWRWRQRFSQYAREDAALRFRARIYDSVMHTVAQSLVMIAGIATLGVGALSVINGEMSVGALIALMMVVWRVMSPIQTTYLSLSRIVQFRETVNQINNLMKMPEERRLLERSRLKFAFKGEYSVRGISFRHAGEVEPALKNISFNVRSGEIVGVIGSTAAGKTTLTKTLMGLYQPQAGNVHIDGMNLRQLDVSDIRTGIGYVPQNPLLFYGTVRQNLALAAPTADEATILNALHEAGVDLSTSDFPDGLNTVIRGATSSIPEGIKMRLCLARAYVKRTSIYIFDDPGAYLDPDGDKAFLKMLHHLKDRATVILVTSRPSHMRACDRLIKLQVGAIAGIGKPEDLLKSSA